MIERVYSGRACGAEGKLGCLQTTTIPSISTLKLLPSAHLSAHPSRDACSDACSQTAHPRHSLTRY